MGGKAGLRTKFFLMQSTFHIIKPDGNMLRLLRRQVKYGIRVKIRKSGKPGTHLQAEQEYLHERPDLIYRIEAGEVVFL